MVRLAALVLGASLAAAKTVELTSSPSSAPIRFPSPAVSQQTLERAHQKSRHIPATVSHSQLGAPPAVVKRDGSFHSSEYTQQGGGHSSGGNFGPTGHSSGGYSSGGYSTGGYSTQPSYSSYEGDSYGGDGYGYTEATTYESGGGGFLGGIGKYGLIIIPILLGITLLFLFPSVINVAGTARNNRGLGDQEDLSDDLLHRAMHIYTSISEEPLCVSRLFCELGSTLGETSFADRTLQYIEYVYPTTSDNMLVLKKAARAKDPQCDVLACKAWEKKPKETLQQRGNRKKSDRSTEKTDSRRHQRM